MRDTTSPVKTT